MDFNNNYCKKMNQKNKKFYSEDYSPLIKPKHLAVNREYEVTTRNKGNRNSFKKENFLPHLQSQKLIQIELYLKPLKQAHEYEISKILMKKIEKCEIKSSNQLSTGISTDKKREILSEITEYFQTSKRHMGELEIFQFLKMVS